MVVDEANNTITYINPDETTDENVNVYEKFNDVPEDAWYENYLSHLVQLGVINGVSEDEFDPDGDVTRAQFATMLACASDADLDSYKGKTSFSDVDVSAWYAPQVEWAYQQGLIKGEGNGLFCPESYITREEAAALLNRYAVDEDSPVLEENQYELDENADEYLSDDEISVLNALLADPVYDDEDDISSWSADDVDAMSVAGIFCGDEDGDFNPQASLKRSECVKIVSAYIINDTKPTFYFPGGSYIEYLDTGDDAVTTSSTEATAGSDEDVVDFNGYGDPPNLDELLGTEENSGEITINWASTTHNSATTAAFSKLGKDRSYITDKMGNEILGFHYDGASHYISGLKAIEVYSYYTDFISVEKANGFEKHFYNGSCSYTGSTSVNAFWSFNNHYYNAYTSYQNGNKETAYKEMGMSIHYLEDMNNPYHATNEISYGDTSPHYKYEHWVPNNVGYVSIYNEDLSESGTGTYRYMYDGTFRNISNSSVSFAGSKFLVCNNFENNSTAAKTATVALLARTERAVAGLLNRFYYNGWLNH